MKGFDWIKLDSGDREALTTLGMFLVAVFMLALATGCASAEQRLASKADYRQAQVTMIQAQTQARTDRENAKAIETAAMWAALAEVVRADPSSSNMVAMVAAVSAARDGDEGASQESMVMLKTEREATALDWVKVLANPVTNIGIAALNMDLQKTIARQNTLVDLANANNDAKMMDTFATLGSQATATYNVSDEAILDMSVANITDSFNETTTSGDTISGDTITSTDSYNETATDSYNVTETTSGDSYADSYNTDDNSDNSIDNSNSEPTPEEEEPAP